MDLKYGLGILDGLLCVAMMMMTKSLFEGHSMWNVFVAGWHPLWARLNNVLALQGYNFRMCMVPGDAGAGMRNLYLVKGYYNCCGLHDYGDPSATQL